MAKPTPGDFSLPRYDGVVSIGETDVPVDIDLDTERISMFASGSPIGEWPVGEFEIERLGDGRYGITAENETLEFRPNEPGRFDAALNGEAPASGGTVYEAPADNEPATPMVDSDDVPPPSQITMVLFYALSGMTAAMGLWALMSIIFG